MTRLMARNTILAVAGLSIVTSPAWAAFDLQLAAGKRAVREMRLSTPDATFGEAPTGDTSATAGESSVAAHVDPFAWPIAGGLFYRGTAGSYSVSRATHDTERLEGYEAGVELTAWLPGYFVTPFVKVGRTMAGQYTSRTRMMSMTLTSVDPDGAITTLRYQPVMSHAALGFGFSPAPAMALFVQGDIARGNLALTGARNAVADVTGEVRDSGRFAETVAWDSRAISVGIEVGM